MMICLDKLVSCVYFRSNDKCLRSIQSGKLKWANVFHNTGDNDGNLVKSPRMIRLGDEIFNNYVIDVLRLFQFLMGFITVLTLKIGSNFSCLTSGYRRLSLECSFANTLWWVFYRNLTPIFLVLQLRIFRYIYLNFRQSRNIKSKFFAYKKGNINLLIL